MSSPLQSYEKEEQAIDLGSGEGSTLLMKGTAGTNERRTKIMWGVLVLVSCIAALSVSAHVSSSRSDPGKETGAVTSGMHVSEFNCAEVQSRAGAQLSYPSGGI